MYHLYEEFHYYIAFLLLTVLVAVIARLWLGVPKTI